MLIGYPVTRWSLNIAIEHRRLFFCFGESSNLWAVFSARDKTRVNSPHCQLVHAQNLVGGLEHFYFSIDWEVHHPN